MFTNNIKFKELVKYIINYINTRELGLLLIELGGGRKKVSDKINFSVGYENVSSLGDYVDHSTPLMKVHASSSLDLEKIKDKILDCFVISEEKKDDLEIIYKKIV